LIIAIGTDIIEVERIQSSVEKFGDKFLNKIFTPAEIEYAMSKKNKFQHLAGRFAAKEAIVKALSECCDKGFEWEDIEVLNNKNGAPYVNLKGKFLDYMANKKRMKISISHTETYAVAFAVLEEIEKTSK
jgi:holo-[acyl-carrier protein] synthase